MEEKRSLCLMFCFVSLVVFGNVTQGEEFLVVFVKDGHNRYILSCSDEKGSWVQVNSSPRRYLTQFQSSYSHPSNELFVTDGIENKSVLVKTSDDSVFVSLRHAYSATALLPISALGTKYIVSSCLPHGSYSSVLVIATHSQTTDVTITFRLMGNIIYDNNTYSDGDKLKVSLEEYQTFTIKSGFDLTGTVVNTTQTVALFTVVVSNVRSVIPSYEQLLPVHLYGQEHIVAVPPLYDSSDVYQLQIISEHSDTRIMFNSGSVFSVDENRLYRQYVTPDANIQLSSSKPIMTLLCKENGVGWFGNHEIVVVPPLTLYTKHAVVDVRGTLRVLSEYAFADIVVQNKSVSNIPGEWKEILGTNYKVGTWTMTNWETLSISSNSRFTVLMSSIDDLFNGGYGVPSSQSDSGEYGYSTIFLF